MLYKVYSITSKLIYYTKGSAVKITAIGVIYYTEEYKFCNEGIKVIWSTRFPYWLVKFFSKLIGCSFIIPDLDLSMSNNSTCQSQMEISKLYLILTGMILEMLRIYEPHEGTGADDIHILL